MRQPKKSKKESRGNAITPQGVLIPTSQDIRDGKPAPDNRGRGRNRVRGGKAL